MNNTINNNFENKIIIIGERLNINEFGIFEKLYNEEATTHIQQGYLDLILTDKLNIGSVNFKFSDREWNFKSLVLENTIKTNLYFYNFDAIIKTTNYYETITKLYVLDSLIKNGVHMTVTKYKCITIQKFLIHLFNKHIYSIESIDLEIVKDYISTLYNYKYRSIVKTKEAIKSFLIFYFQILNKNIDEPIVDYLDEINSTIIKADIINNKHSLLPQHFMEKLKDISFNQSLNENNSKTFRRAAGLIFIGTQTGIRPFELLALEKNCITDIKVKGIKVSYLNYKSTKSVHGEGYISGKTIANKRTVEIVNNLLTIEDKESKLLAGKLTYNTLNESLKKICIENCDLLGNISHDYPKEYDGKCEIVVRDGVKKYIGIPVMKQFRVYFVSELTQRGYSEWQISKLLNHQDEKMLNYYARPPQSIQEDPMFSEIIIKDVIENDYNILGTNGNKYKKRMEDFILNRNIQVKEDLDSIVKDIMNNVPIRQKLGGCCIKPNPFRTCEHDAPTDELFCAYGLCQNQCHFFYNIPYYLSRFNDGIEIIDMNLKMKFKQQAQKELYKIQHIINNKLLPEMDELKNELNKKGRDVLLERHPSLIEIIDNYNEIQKELIKWKQKTL